MKRCIAIIMLCISLFSCKKDYTTYHNIQAEASCGQCQFKMKGSGCDLAVRIANKTYYVDGTNIDDHGDAHAADGFCNAIKKVIISGDAANKKIQITSFKIVS